MLRLNALLTQLQRQPTFARLAASLADPPAGQTPLLSAITPARPYALAALHAALCQPLLVVTARPGDARHLAEELRAWVDSPDAVTLFPETDALPYDRLPNDPDKLADRLATLQCLSGVSAPADPPLVVTSVRGAMDLVMDVATFRASHRYLRRGDRVAPTDLVDAWLRLGYEPAPVVDQPGQFGRRGGILDVFPPGGSPLRFEFWGDEIDTIRTFDPGTQRSVDQRGDAVIGPAHEVLPAPLAGELELAHLRPQFRDPYERDQRLLADGQAFGALEFYRGFFGQTTILDYLPAEGLLVVDEPELVATLASEFELQVEQLHTDLLERGEVPRGIARPYRPWGGLALPARRLHLSLDPDAESLPFVHAPRYAGQLELFLDEVVDPAKPLRSLVVSQQSARLGELLQDQHLHVPEVEAAPAQPGPVTLLHGLLREGWRAPELGLELLTDGELFGWTKQRRAAPPRRTAEHAAAARDAFIADLKPGDLVVHVDHGIGRFGGMIRTAIGFTPDQEVQAKQAPPSYAEFLLLEYAGGDKLYVPIAQADRVSRYVGAGDTAPALTRLGTGEWSRAKAKVRRSVRDIAHELMELYAARQAVEGHTYPEDTTWQAELEGSFPFVETADQVRAIDAVKQDMESAKPMDRLLVGDVGFGKTEVALRAAFKAVQDGRQAAVLVPTTVLAQQHYNTFRDRLASFPVRVEMLSRFRSEREQQVVLKGLADGSVDIVVGTHRLVQKDVQFKSLGLVVIDEEQRFGVTHKERLKQLRKEVDVLTLTATPIPRTLHMGLVGVRDMSILETPPEARMPVRTYVTGYEEGLVQEAILREIDRGGQVYFVHNRVQGIETIANRLRKLAPEARIAVGHGQMPEEILEQTMLQFAEGEFDVLVCTTIIESGLDIPNANTLIINNAHRFGLAQLYQLRGRVGRSGVRAYAYLLYTRDAALTEIARERLQTIFEATELGAGMRIAMKDLEIRGAGTLLGAQQSGFIAAVGFDLYTKLLAEQVDLLKARSNPALAGSAALRVSLDSLREQLSIDLPINGFLPPDYVADDPVRLRLYQRFAEVTDDAQLRDLVAEVEDRFGKLPQEVQDLVYLVSLRLRAVEARVRDVAVLAREIVVRLEGTPPFDTQRLSKLIGAPVTRASNQLRIPVGNDAAWMGRLYALLEALGEAASRTAAMSVA